MDKTRTNKGKFFLGQKEQKLNQKILTFIFFLALAFLLWLLNALDHNYSTNISFPIKYIHFQPNEEMVGNIPSELNINVNGHGYALLKNIIGANSHPIILRVMSLNFIEIDSAKSYVLTRNLKESIQRQLGSDISINYILPDTLLFTFSPIVHKKVAIEPIIDVEYEQQYMSGGDIISQPDSIIISGPQAVIDTIYSVQTISKKISKANKSFTVDLKLNSIDNVNFDKKVVTLTIPVDKFTESSIYIPIRCVNLPDSMEIKMFPSSIKVNYIVSLRNYNMVNQRLFRATVDYRTRNVNINNKLKVTLEKQPSFVKSVNYYPKNVDFIIEK